MRPFVWAPLLLLGASSVASTLAFKHEPARSMRPRFDSAQVRAAAHAELAPGLNTGALPLDPEFSRLPKLHFSNENVGQSADVRLYDDAGYIDEHEAARLDALLCDTRDPKNMETLRLDRRTLQLTVRAAFHFRSVQVQVVSAYRKPRRSSEGPHASGRAIDFKLPGVPARRLAAYLRTLPRVGVGVYTHPKTSYVHLDDRAQSFFWLDASPPGRTWRERSLGNAGIAQRDASYTRAGDWPEGTLPPSDAL